MNYSKLYKFLAPLIKWIYRIESVGAENIPEGGVIVASNHTAFSDVLVLSAAAGGRQIKYMAKKELFYTPLAPIIRAFGAFPVDRHNSDVSSIKKTISLISEGAAVGIFPQGTRRGGEDLRMTEVKSGVSMIAYRTKAPVIPVLIENSRMKTGIFRKNRVVFGKPICYDELYADVGNGQSPKHTEYETAARAIFSRICEIKYGNALSADEAAKGETR